MTLSEEQKLECWKQRANKRSWTSIARIFNVSPQTLRYALNPELEEIRRQRRLARDRAIRAGKARTRRNVHFETVQRVVPAPDIMLERDRRMSIPYRDFTSEFMGDPKPGFSALDKKQRVFG